MGTSRTTPEACGARPAISAPQPVTNTQIYLPYGNKCEDNHFSAWL
jgi:hypothetical protein